MRRGNSDDRRSGQIERVLSKGGLVGSERRRGSIDTEEGDVKPSQRRACNAMRLQGRGRPTVSCQHVLSQRLPSMSMMWFKKESFRVSDGYGSTRRASLRRKHSSVPGSSTCMHWSLVDLASYE